MKSLFMSVARRSFSDTTRQTSVYVWKANPQVGSKAAELKQQFTLTKGVPKRVEAFQDMNVQQLLIGHRHSAAITGDGRLYLFGSGNWGVLGNGSEKDASFERPQLVEYFIKKNLKVVSAALGEYHSVALTEDGSVYTWGYAGKKGYFNWMYSQEVGALGHGDKEHHFIPKKVEYFAKNNIKIEKISAGMYHTLALSTSGQLYSWGRGLYGVLGNGSNSYSLVPELNEELEILRKEDPVNNAIKKLDAADDYSGVLLNDGSLWVWGKNDRGQLGSGSGIGIDMTESENVPINIEAPSGLPIRDFHTGMNSMLILDTEHNVFKTGLKLDYVPKEVRLPEEFDKGSELSQVSGMTCGRKHYVLWNRSNQILAWGNVFKEKPHKDIDKFGLHFASTLFDGGSIKDLSMKYGVFGALIEN